MFPALVALTMILRPGGFLKMFRPSDTPCRVHSLVMPGRARSSFS